MLTWVHPEIGLQVRPGVGAENGRSYGGALPARGGPPAAGGRALGIDSDGSSRGDRPT